MNTAVVAIITGGTVQLATVGATWHLVKSGRVRLSSPSTAQLQAEAGSQAQETGLTRAGDPEQKNSGGVS